MKVLEAFKNNIKLLRHNHSTQKSKKPSLNHSAYESKQYMTAKKPTTYDQ